jgi:putative membrane protein
MAFLSSLTVTLLALLHIYILVLEMFLWTTPRGLRSFGLTPEFARETKALAANQGLYNGFLAAGLVWGLSRLNCSFWHWSLLRGFLGV